MSEDYIEPLKENIERLSYDVIDCMSPGDADEWADEIFNFDYESDRELKQQLKLKVTQYKQNNFQQNQPDTRDKLTYKDILDEEREKRLRLIRNLSEFEKSVQDLRRMAKSEKNQTISRIIQQTEKFEEKKNEFMKDFLAVKPNPIFITGETSAGKSSFINLLLEDDIMPVDFEQSSSTFCIITRHESKRAVVHYKSSNKPKRIIEDKGNSEEFNAEIQKYLATKTNDIAYVELMCPSPVLQDDVVIMDSPGMGDPDFSEGLKEKIKNSCAFVYVLKHFNPIGEDCWELAGLVKSACSSSKESSSHIDTDAMVFIVNKWDTVQRNKMDTYHSVVRRLKDFLGSVSESRVLTMSVRDGRFMQRHAVEAEDYKKFLELLHSLQISAITNKTRKFHGLVVDYMDTIVETLDFLGLVLDTDMKDRQAKADILDKMREKINVKLDEYYNMKKEDCERIVQKRTSALRNIMKSDPQLRQTFLNLMSHTVPYAISRTDMDQQVAKLAAEKLSTVLESQEKKDHFLHDVRAALINEFFSKFHEFEVTMKESQQSLFVGHQLSILGKDKSLVERALPHWSKLTVKQKIMYGVAMPVYGPFIVGVFLVSINAQILQKLYNMLPNQDRLVTLEERREYVNRRANEIFQRYTDKEEYLKAYVTEIMKDVWSTLDQLYKDSKKQLDNLRDDARVLREENAEDCRIIQSSKILRKKLQQYLLTLYKFEFECLQYDRVLQECLFIYDDESNPISFSTNSAIYGVTVTEGAMEDMKEMGHEYPTDRAALKRVFWKVMADDVHALQTDIQMSILHSNNPNMLRMIRVVKSAPNCEVINVSLLCEAVSMSFRPYIHEKTNNMSGKEKYRYMYEKFSEVQKGLAYLHSCEEKTGNKTSCLTGYELNLDTIMVTAEGKVKLMNLKCPGHLQFPITATQDLVHGYRHLPPPVILNERIYNASADMYSLAIAQYEAWFRAEAFLEFTFDRFVPKDTLYKFADNLRDPIDVLSNGPHVKAVGNDQQTIDWFQSTCNMIKDYMTQKNGLSAESWPSYFESSAAPS